MCVELSEFVYTCACTFPPLFYVYKCNPVSVSYTHLDVYKRQVVVMVAMVVTMNMMTMARTTTTSMMVMMVLLVVTTTMTTTK